MNFAKEQRMRKEIGRLHGKMELLKKRLVVKDEAIRQLKWNVKALKEQLQDLEGSS